jgi:DNA-binding winged helix-turn-helix (wHTH) protein
MAPTKGNGHQSRPPFQVGEWLVEPDLDRISRGSEQYGLRPRVTELLVCLADRAGELATKQYLIDNVWRTEFVTVNALTQLIAELRRALGDNAEDPRYIETIPRRGYRLISPTVAVRPTNSLNTKKDFRFMLVDDQDVEMGLVEGENIIGRSPDVAIRIDTSKVSRHHACIRVAGNTATIEDLGSKNGTFLRGRRLEQATRIEDSDEIQIGANLARFQFKVLDDETRTDEDAD